MKVLPESKGQRSLQQQNKFLSFNKTSTIYRMNNRFKIGVILEKLKNMASDDHDIEPFD